MGRAPCCDKANVKKGPWSPEEDAKLKSYMSSMVLLETGSLCPRKLTSSMEGSPKKKTRLFAASILVLGAEKKRIDPCGPDLPIAFAIRSRNRHIFEARI
ncbi:hypothetical protein PTKIN_Ptkin01aG0057200 [Pterospermum kingtungense]